MSVIPAPCPKHYTVTTSVTQEDGGDSVLLDTIGIENTSTGERYALIIIKPDAGYTVGLPNFSIGGGTPSLTSTFSTALSAGIMHFEPGVGGVTQAMMPNFSKIVMGTSDLFSGTTNNYSGWIFAYCYFHSNFVMPSANLVIDVDIDGCAYASAASVLDYSLTSYEGSDGICTSSIWPLSGIVADRNTNNCSSQYISSAAGEILPSTAPTTNFSVATGTVANVTTWVSGQNLNTGSWGNGSASEERWTGIITENVPTKIFTKNFWASVGCHFTTEPEYQWLMSPTLQSRYSVIEYKTTEIKYASILDPNTSGTTLAMDGTNIIALSDIDGIFPGMLITGNSFSSSSSINSSIFPYSGNDIRVMTVTPNNTSSPYNGLSTITLSESNEITLNDELTFSCYDSNGNLVAKQFEIHYTHPIGAASVNPSEHVITWGSDANLAALVSGSLIAASPQVNNISIPQNLPLASSTGNIAISGSAGAQFGLMITNGSGGIFSFLNQSFSVNNNVEEQIIPLSGNLILPLTLPTVASNTYYNAQIIKTNNARTSFGPNIKDSGTLTSISQISGEAFIAPSIIKTVDSISFGQPIPVNMTIPITNSVKTGGIIYTTGYNTTQPVWTSHGVGSDFAVVDSDGLGVASRFSANFLEYTVTEVTQLGGVIPSVRIDLLTTDSYANGGMPYSPLAVGMNMLGRGLKYRDAKVSAVTSYADAATANSKRTSSITVVADDGRGLIKGEDIFVGDRYGFCVGGMIWRSLSGVISGSGTTELSLNITGVLARTPNSRGEIALDLETSTKEMVTIAPSSANQAVNCVKAGGTVLINVGLGDPDANAERKVPSITVAISAGTLGNNSSAFNNNTFYVRTKVLRSGTYITYKSAGGSTAGQTATFSFKLGDGVTEGATKVITITMI